MEILGIDVGGSGIKGAIVDVEKGIFVNERIRIETPKPATPEAMAIIVKQIAQQNCWNGIIGCGFPAVVQNNFVRTASNIDKSWINVNIKELFAECMPNTCIFMNDADAVGMAESTFGAGANENGLILVVTLGSGIGTALIYNHILIPNSEFGHLKIRGKIAEKLASSGIKEQKKLSWKDWGKRLNEYFQYLDFLINPDLIIVGGGISKKHEHFLKYINVKCPIMPAKLFNNAGIVGAAMYAAQKKQ